MWTYKQASGWFGDASGEIIATGYSGFGSGKNNPVMQHVHDIGPIPVGEYEISPPCSTETHGPCVLKLTPKDGNEMFGRGGFLIHGDSLASPGTASHGCIILPRTVRERIAASDDNQLRVVTL